MGIIMVYKPTFTSLGGPILYKWRETIHICFGFSMFIVWVSEGKQEKYIETTMGFSRDERTSLMNLGICGKTCWFTPQELRAHNRNME